MSNEDWYPTKLSDRIPFHANLNVQAQATGTTYGLSAADKTDIGNDATNVALVVNFKEAVAAFSQAVTEWAEIVLNAPVGTALPLPPAAPSPPALALGSKAAIQARTRQYAGIIKADADYTAEIGELYGIIAPAAGPPADPSIALATPTAGTSNIVLRLKKGGYDIIAVDMRRGGGDWTQIGVSQTAEFTDSSSALTPGVPEQREYRCQGMQNNARTGGISPSVSAVTVP